MPLSQARGESERFADVLLLQIGEIGEQVFHGAPCRQRLDDHSNGHAHAADARLATHDVRIQRYAAEDLHVVIIAQLCYSASGDKGVSQRLDAWTQH